LQLAEKEHRRCADDYYQPVGEADRHYVEESTSEFNNQYLSHKYHNEHQHEFAAIFHVQSRASGSESASVEEVPELKENEDREEYS